MNKELRKRIAENNRIWEQLERCGYHSGGVGNSGDKCAIVNDNGEVAGYVNCRTNEVEWR